MLASFQIDSYHIDKLTVDMLASRNHPEMELQYFATSRSEYKESQWHGDVALGFRQVSKEDNDATIFEVTIAGSFTMDGEQADEDKATFEKRLRLNGASTLIPIARAALVSTMSIMGRPNKYKLPNLNVLEMQWNEQ